MTSRLSTLAASVLTGAARVALGALWLNEGLLKYRADFGAADIQLVADSASSNSRVPGFFQAFTETFLEGWPHLLGLVMPLLETCLGLALIIGVFTLPAALMSVFTLMTYWLADQLTGQYPLMVMLAVGVSVFPLAASRLSAITLALSTLRKRRPNSLWLHEPVRRWL